MTPRVAKLTAFAATTVLTAAVFLLPANARNEQSRRDMPAASGKVSIVSYSSKGLAVDTALTGAINGIFDQARPLEWIFVALKSRPVGPVSGDARLPRQEFL